MPFPSSFERLPLGSQEEGDLEAEVGFSVLFTLWYLQLRLGPLKHGDLLELDLHEVPWDRDKDGACKGGSPHDDIKVGVGKTVVIGGGMWGLGEGGAQEQ